jgi:Protein of unknown function (DUF3800)
MKFIYVDESGGSTQSDVFVMTGLLVDAYRLRKYTAEFDKMIVDFLAKHPGSPKELKTKNLINGSGKWSQVDPVKRKQFITDVCDIACKCARAYPVASLRVRSAMRQRRSRSTLRQELLAWRRALHRIAGAAKHA